MSPYRQSEKPSAKKLPRKLARLRGYLRHIIMPTICASIAGLFIGLACLSRYQMAAIQLESTEHSQTVHFQEWDKAVNERQAALDARERTFNDNVAAYRMAFRKEAETK